MIRSRAVAAACVAAVVAAGLSGCSGGNVNDGLNSQEHQQADRLGQIAQRADGDWNKVPPADQQYVLKNFAGGNVGQAKMLIFTESGKSMHGAPGGPKTAAGH